MTENTVITATEAIKNKVKFEEFIANLDKSQFEEILKDYPQNSPALYITDLTQKAESFINAVNELNGINPYIIWIVTNTKQEILKNILFFNRTRSKNVGIFVFKAILNEDKIEFECIIKPPKVLRTKNEDSDKFYMDYWNKYSEICNKIDKDVQVRPQPKRWQMIGVGNSKVQIMQTISRLKHYIASELYIQDKNIYDLLYEYKDEIEKELGELKWLRLDNKKASRIVKYIYIDVENPENIEKVAETHIRMAWLLKNRIVKKYLPIRIKKLAK